VYSEYSVVVAASEIDGLRLRLVSTDRFVFNVDQHADSTSERVSPADKALREERSCNSRAQG